MQEGGCGDNGGGGQTMWRERAMRSEQHIKSSQGEDRVSAMLSGYFITWTAGGGRCTKSDSGVADNATRAGGDDNGKQQDWVAYIATKSGDRRWTTTTGNKRRGKKRGRRRHVELNSCLR